MPSRTYDVAVVIETEMVFRVQAGSVAEAETQAENLAKTSPSSAIDTCTDVVEVGPAQEVQPGAL